ncbi:MAG: hypothetical protein ABIF77_18415 [bacterium]
MDHHQPLPESDELKRSVKMTRWRLVCLALLASAWGLSELIGGETVVLVAVALLLLAIGRTVLNRLGTSTAMTAIAVLFKSVNTAPFLCHLAGIALLGIAFDLMATLLWREERKPFLRAAFTGATSAYLSCFLFATSMIWIVEFKHWAGGGFERLGEYLLSSGTRGAVTALVVVPLGLWLGRQLARQAVGHPRTVLGATVAACLALWVLGPFAG